MKLHRWLLGAVVALLSTAALSAATPATASAATYGPFWYESARIEWPGHCLDVEGGRTGNGTPVQAWICHRNQGRQLWYTDTRLDGQGREIVRLRNYASNRCLSQIGLANQAYIWDCDDAPWRWWYATVHNGQFYRFQNVDSGLCLDVYYPNGDVAKVAGSRCLACDRCVHHVARTTWWTQ